MKAKDRITGNVIVCPKCKKEQLRTQECRYCGIVIEKARRGPAQPAPPVPETTEVEDFTAFIGPQADTYIRTFKKFSGSGAYVATWHWPAFFLPLWWFLYRKLYFWAFFGFVVTAIFILNCWVMAGQGLYFNNGLCLVALVGFGLSTNYIFYSHVKKKVDEVRSAQPTGDVSSLLSREGGVNHWVKPAAGGFLVVCLVLVTVAAIPVITDLKNRASRPEIPMNALLRPVFFTSAGPYEAGTAFITKIPQSTHPLLLTPHHVFGPRGGFGERYAWDELKGLVEEVMANSIENPKMEVTASEVLPIPGAERATLSDRSRDLAAFVVRDKTNIPVLKLAEKEPQKGQPVWLYARTFNDPQKNTSLYYGIVEKADGAGLVFRLDDSGIRSTAVSGAPVLNKQGEVVAINVASRIEASQLFCIGNPVTSIRKHLTAALAMVGK